MVDVDVDKCWFPKDDKDCSNLAAAQLTLDYKTASELNTGFTFKNIFVVER